MNSDLPHPQALTDTAGLSVPDRPLVTFFIMGYEQEQLIREAINGAFAQTYSPLEIILSDDCSPDDTFRIMQEMAAEYDGPHRIRLNRNSRNLGIISHIDRIMELAAGEFVVQAAGDDVSRPERTELLVRTWLGSERQVRLVHSAVTARTPGEPTRLPTPIVNTTTTPEIYVRENRYVIGAAQGWSKEIYDVFGPLSPQAILEDRPLPFRALMLGGVGFVSIPLVLYRPGGVSERKPPQSGKEMLYGVRLRYLRWFASSYRCYLKDMKVVDFTGKRICQKVCEDEARKYEFEVRLADGSYPERLKAFPRAMLETVRQTSLNPLRRWFQYTFDRLYVHFWNVRHDKA